MANKYTPYEQLKFSDDYMFKSVMIRENICRRVLERILGERVREIKFHEAEKSVKNSLPGKGVRLDVYLWNDTTAYDIEMQTKAELAIGRHARYYQSSMDMDSLKSGEDYQQLKEGIVIFICLEDPFQRGISRYTFRERCEEAQDLDPKIGTRKIFLYANGNADQETEEMRRFLDYLRDGLVPEEDELIRDIEDAVQFERQDTRGKEIYRGVSMPIVDAENRTTIRINTQSIMHLMHAHGMTFDEAADFLGLKKLDRENCRTVIEKEEQQPSN
jgi:predicted transposase/invertase (TIGR01784 family)